MSRFFNMDNPVFVALGRLADFMILNLLFMLTCIPVFTIGASCTALSYMTLKMVRNEETYIARGYFKSFKENFRQATIIWMGILILILIFFMDFNIISQMQGSVALVMKITLAAICFFFFMGYVYIFPVLSKFENNCRNTVKNAFIMAIANLPSTIATVAIDVIAVVLTFLNTVTLSWAPLVWILVGFSGVSYFNSWFFVKVFDKYIPKTEEESENDAGYEEDAGIYEMTAFKNLQPQPFKEDKNEQ